MGKTGRTWYLTGSAHDRKGLNYKTGWQSSSKQNRKWEGKNEFIAGSLIEKASTLVLAEVMGDG